MKHNLKMAAMAVAAFGALCTQGARADTLNFGGMYYSPADTVEVIFPGSVTPSLPAVDENAYSGGFNMSDTSGSWMLGSKVIAKNASFIAYCLDIYDNMKTAGYTLETNPLALPISHNTMTLAKETAIERLASNDLSLVHDAKTSSAFQLAIWEIMAETGPGYDVNAGTFHVKNDADGANTLANTWLANLGTKTPTMKLEVWRANEQGSTQDLAVFAPVPEPTSWAMGLLGLGALGTLVRRKSAAI